MRAKICSFRLSHVASVLALTAVALWAQGSQAALIISSVEGGIGAFTAATGDVINIGTPTFSSQSNVGGSQFVSDPLGTALNNGTIYSDGSTQATEGGRAYCPSDGSSITFNLASPQTIYRLFSISGGLQDRRSQKFRLEFGTLGTFTTVANESQINFTSLAGNGEMRVLIADSAGAPLGTNVDQIRVTYFNTAAPNAVSMYRELDVFNNFVATANPLPPVTSANLTYHLDASNMNNDAGLTNPGDGANITSWKELTTGVSANIQSTPSWRAAGLSGKPSVRFDGGAAGGDLVYSNNPAIVNIQAQTIIAVASMAQDAFVLSDLVSDSSGLNNIRQTTTETAAYYSGNSGDFHFGAGGSFTINGNPRFDIPGGFGALHVVKSVRGAPVNINSIRIGDNANNRIWAGDVAEIIVYNGKLSGNDLARVNRYLIDKYGVNQVVDEPLSATTQVATDPFADGGKLVQAVNFRYSTAPVTGSFQGIFFDNVNLTGGTPPAGPFNLTANLQPASLALNFNFSSDNGPRTQGTGFTGPDAATLNAVAGEMFYVGGTHPQATMTFSGLWAGTDSYVQVIGGDAGWNGDLAVVANGQAAGTWMSVADSNGNTPSLFAFYTKTNSLGQLQLDFTIAAGNFAGISGVIITQRVPEPSTLALIGLGAAALVPFARRRRRSGSPA